MLRRWLRRRKSPPPDLDALRHIYLNLFDVQRSHALIDVVIDGSDASYQSIILGVDPEAGTVTIDELFPPGFIGLPGQPVTVTVRLDGSRRLSFASRITLRGRDADAVEYYQLMLPDALDYNQRRGAFRLKLGHGWSVTSDFLTPDLQRRSAAVRDLSSTGIRLALRQQAPLNAGDELRDLHFEFAGRTFQCRAGVRNVDSEGADGTVVGATFLDLPKPEQRSLERMIMQLQRQQAQQVASVAG
jgi:c-di-GMP-binding flagellar brake protein YcgR